MADSGNLMRCRPQTFNHAIFPVKRELAFGFCERIRNAGGFFVEWRTYQGNIVSITWKSYRRKPELENACW